VARPAGPKLNILPDLAHLIDAAIAGAVDLQDVDVLAGRNGATAVANTAGGRGRPLLAVQGLGEDARGAGLADAAGAGEEVSVSDAVAFESVDEGLRDGFLANEIG